MTLSEYQEQAKRTLGNASMDNLIMGVIGETGEIIDYLKKVMYHGHPIDKLKFELELGDLAWYVVSIITRSELSLTGADISVMNPIFDPPTDLHEWWWLLWEDTTSLIYTDKEGDLTTVWSCVLSVLCRIREGADLIGSSLERVLELNTKKLLEHYPNGFEEHRSIYRR